METLLHKPQTNQGDRALIPKKAPIEDTLN
jgi:hypothetical protein